jgi:hypothetical protein
MTTGPDAACQGSPLPQGAGPARLIVLERAGRWAMALRRDLPEPGVRVYETRSVAGCWEMLGQCPASFVVAELAPVNARALLERMARLERDFPWARVAVVAERSLASCEWLMREAGAVHFAVSTRQARPLARMALRHLQTVPEPPQTFAEQIWSGLPWRRWERMKDEG